MRVVDGGLKEGVGCDGGFALFVGVPWLGVGGGLDPQTRVDLGLVGLLLLRVGRKGGRGVVTSSVVWRWVSRRVGPLGFLER